MSLNSLVKAGQLKAQRPSASEVQRLVAAAKRNLLDAEAAGISDETRFDAAYKAIMQCALLALRASGYRPATNVPGHHQTLIQSLALTVGVASDDIAVLDTLRRKRNLSDYSGDPVDSETLRETVSRAEALMHSTDEWLRRNHATLINRT